ncbi:MAG: hypothetical protein ACTSU5_00405 [Promethearchaeota archaeon]
MIAILYKRKPNIFQMQLTDYLFGRSVERYRSWVPLEYNAMRKKFVAWLPVARRARRVVPPPPGRDGQTALDQFLYPELPATLPKPAYLLRFRSSPQATREDFAADIISPLEWDALRAFPAFQGFFEHLFELNDLSFFDDLQAELEAGGARFKGIFVHDVIAWELFRRQLGFPDYTGVEKLSYFVGSNPLAGVLRNPEFFPRAADVSHVLTRLPPGRVVDYFHDFVRECIALGVIQPHLLV